tara:strand:- start:5181 stop:5990 length:810 start_codon:yes stop_codon:yes gene_type:complete
MSLTGKTKGETYKDLVVVDNSNNGIDGTLRTINSGGGAQSPLYISNAKVKIQPTSNSTTMFQICNSSGTVQFTLDTTNGNTLIGRNQVYANTQFAYWGINSTDSANIDANYHVAIPFITGGNQSLTGDDNNWHNMFGGGGDPSTTASIDTEADDLVTSIMYCPAQLYIDSVNIMVAGDAASGDTIRFHLMSYDMVTTDGATAGNLSNGLVVGDHSDVVHDGYEQLDHIQLDLDATNRTVSAGKVLMLMFRCDSANSDYSINCTMQYHLF